MNTAKRTAKHSWRRFYLKLRKVWCSEASDAKKTEMFKDDICSEVSGAPKFLFA